jgi:hypothetical protein
MLQSLHHQIRGIVTGAASPDCKKTFSAMQKVRDELRKVP